MAAQLEVRLSSATRHAMMCVGSDWSWLGQDGEAMRLWAGERERGGHDGGRPRAHHAMVRAALFALLLRSRVACLFDGDAARHDRSSSSI
eukprot:1883626-Rhodomonas_salina.1